MSDELEPCPNCGERKWRATNEEYWHIDHRVLMCGACSKGRHIMPKNYVTFNKLKPNAGLSPCPNCGAEEWKANDKKMGSIPGTFFYCDACLVAEAFVLDVSEVSKIAENEPVPNPKGGGRH